MDKNRNWQSHNLALQYSLDYCSVMVRHAFSSNRSRTLKAVLVDVVVEEDLDAVEGELLEAHRLSLLVVNSPRGRSFGLEEGIGRLEIDVFIFWVMNDESIYKSTNSW